MNASGRRLNSHCYSFFSDTSILTVLGSSHRVAVYYLLHGNLSSHLCSIYVLYQLHFLSLFLLNCCFFFFKPAYWTSIWSTTQKEEWYLCTKKGQRHLKVSMWSKEGDTMKGKTSDNFRKYGVFSPHQKTSWRSNTECLLSQVHGKVLGAVLRCC